MPFLGTQAEPGVNTDRFLVVLSKLSGSVDWLREIKSLPRPRNDSVLELQVVRTRLFLNMSIAKDEHVELIMLLIEHLVSLDYNIGTADILEAVNFLKKTLTILTEDEVEVLDVIRGLAHGNPYTTSVSEQAVKNAYRDATISIDKLLSSLEQRGVIRTERGGMLRMAF